MPTLVACVENKNEDVNREAKFSKRTELSIYSEMSQATEQSENKSNNDFVLQIVKSFRMEGCKLIDQVQSISDRCSRFFNTGVSHTLSNYQTTVEFLHEERNLLPRIGAIGGGALCGYIFGLRKGFIKRILYTTTGSVGVGAVCYPKEAENYYEQLTQLSKKYFIISYHFINGGKYGCLFFTKVKSADFHRNEFSVVTKDLAGFELPSFPLQMLTHDSEQDCNMQFKYLPMPFGAIDNLILTLASNNVEDLGIEYLIRRNDK